MEKSTKKDFTDAEIEKIGSYPKFLGIRLSAWLEMAVFFGAALLLAWLFRFPLNYLSFSPHPFWIIVILMSVQYGTNEGLLAAIVASAIVLLGPYPARDILQDKFQYLFVVVKLPVLWLVSAVILGEIRKRHIRERDMLKEVALSARKKEKVITDSYNSLKKIKEKLERRVASQMQTAMMAYDSFKELEKTDKYGIIKGAMDLLETLIAPEKFSLYLLENEALQLAASQGWEESDIYSKKINSVSLIFEEIVSRHRPLSVMNAADRNILEKEGVLAVPIISVDSKAIFGMIKVEKIPFLRLRITAIESCRTIGEWVGLAFDNYYAAEEAQKGQFVSKKSGLLTPKFFQFQKEFLIKLCKRLKVSITLLQVSILGINTLSDEKRSEVINTFRDVLQETIRSVDQAFEYDRIEGEFSILLVNTNLANSEIVRKKITAALKDKLDKSIQISFLATPLYEEQAKTASAI